MTMHEHHEGRCADCGATEGGPLLRDEVWATIARADEYLCRACIEKRLGRPVTDADSDEDWLRGRPLHTSARALILAAAEKSGLLRGVAEALAFAHKEGAPPFGCGPCELLGELTEAFDDHTGLPARTVASTYGCASEAVFVPDDEVRPFLYYDGDLVRAREEEDIPF